MFWNLADFSLQALLKTLQSACPALHFVECAGAFTDSPLNFYLLSVRAAVQPDPQPMSQHRRGSGEERPMRGRSDPGDDGDEEEDNAGNGEESGPLTPLPASGRCKVVAVASLLCPPPQSRL